CPRTHAYFGHAPHPWRLMLLRGINVALGTDSRASNPDLSLWNELLFLHDRFPDLPKGELLSLGTLAGARALGLDGETGSLTPGKRSDLAVVSLSIGSPGDAFGALFRAENRITAVMREGGWLIPPVAC